MIRFNKIEKQKIKETFLKKSIYKNNNILLII